MKRIVVWAVLLSVGAVVCAEGTTEGAAAGTGGKVVLDWMAPMSAGPELDLWKGLITEYEAGRPNVKINLNVEAWNDYWTKIAVMFAGGQYPDVCWMHNARFRDYAELGSLRPLDDLMAADAEFDKKAFPDVLNEIFVHKGKQYAVAKDHGMYALWWNGDKFTDAGLRLPWADWTWDDFLVLALKLTKDTDGDGRADQWAINDLSYNGAPASWWHHETGWALIRTFGGDTYSANMSETRISSPQTVAALQYVADLLNKHKVAARAENVAGLGDPWRVGKTAMSGFPHASQGFFLRYEKRPIKNYGVEYLPQAARGGRKQAVVGTTGFAIPSKSGSPKEAWQYLKWATGEYVGTKVQQHWRWGSNRKKLLDLRFKDQEAKGISIEQNWERVLVRPFFPEKSDIAMGYPMAPAGLLEIESILDTQFDPVWLGRRTAEQAAKDAQPQIDAVLAKYYRK